MTDLDRLDALAAAATPGPWTGPTTGPAVVKRIDRDSQDRRRHTFLFEALETRDREIDGEQARANAAFIAACDPATIRELVDDARRGREIEAAAREVSDELDDAQIAWIDFQPLDAAHEMLRAARHREAGTAERRCVECREPWPCDATVHGVKDGIPHRIGVTEDVRRG